jgi:PAS domain S-box-containing protein
MLSAFYASTINVSVHAFASGDFYPHGYCYLWNKGLVWLNVASDLLIAIAYFAIPVVLLWFIRKRRDLPFRWMFVVFCVFIVACGTTHLMEVWNLWHAQYWLAGAVKAITAAVSLPTAFFLAQLIPQALDLPSNRQWMETSAFLKQELHEHKELELDLRASEARYREVTELLDLTHDAIFARNLRGQITFWNRGAERLYGWQEEEVRGKASSDLLETVFPQPFDVIEAQFLEKGYWEGELVHRRRDGGKVLVNSRWALRTDLSGKPAAVLESNRDVTRKMQEESRFRSLLEAAPDAMVIVNQAGVIQFVNAQTEKLFGYSRQEILGRPVEMLIPQSLQELHITHRSEYLALPAARGMAERREELYAVRKDGKEFPTEVSLSPIETAEGILISSAIRDITQRKQLEMRFHEQEERFRLIVTGMTDYAIFMLDPEGHVVSWNAGAQRIKGYRAEEILGRHFSQFYSKEDVALGKPTDELRIAAQEGRCEDEGWRIRKDGTRFWANAVITALRDESGRLRGFGKVTRDMTERKEIEERLEQQRGQLARSNAELIEINKELESFSYSVSHDLRAPLRSIDGFSHALLEDCADKLTEAGQDYLNRIRAATQRMGMLIDDLLNLSRITRGEIHLEDLNISDLVRSILDSLERMHPDRRIEFKIDEGLQVQADQRLLRVALENLLNNAWKFTSKCPLARIDFGKTNANGASAYFIRDNGAGFDPAYADRLFGAFQRLHTVAEFPGTGVGLATVQRIIRRHGGQIWAEGAVDRGATFFFTLADTHT